jgi:hypothetical protein
MGRTNSSFRIALTMEKEEWKPYRNALDKLDRKKFDEMFGFTTFNYLKRTISLLSGTLDLILSRE